jgi:thioredoxin 1
MAIDAPIHTTESNLARVLGAGLPVLLVFWQRDCPPCDQLASTLDRLARTYAGRALIVKVNATDEKRVLSTYNINQVPSIVFIKQGQALATATGAVSEQELTGWLNYLTKGEGARPPIPTGPSIPLPAAQSNYAPPSSASPRQSSAEGQPVVLTDATFDQAIRSAKVPVMVDFWAVWCGPCKMVAPAVEQMAAEFSGRALLGKLNVDENPGIAGRYGIMSIPTLLIFRGGQIVDRIVGAQPAHVLRQRLVQQLS